MSEFDLFAQELLEKAEAEEKQQQERDRKLIDRVLEIYDQKYVAELPRNLFGGNRIKLFNRHTIIFFHQ